MSKTCSNLDIVLAHDDPKTRATIAEALEALNYKLCAVCDTVESLLSACEPATPDLIFSGIEMPDGSAIDALVKISERDPTPAIVVTPNHSLRKVEEALRDHVMAYLVEPIDFEQISPTIYLVCERFREFEALKSENDDLKQALSDRKLIERAKGIVMGKFELEEGEAFRKMQNLAKSQRTKLVNVAQAIIASTERNAG